MLCYQDNQFFSPALPCSGEKLREIINSPQVKWKIDSIRSLRKPDAIKIWGSNTEFQKYCLKEEAKKNGDKFKALSDEEKLARYANNLKESLPPLIFGARDFDEVPMKKDPTKMMKRRVLKGIHLSGLFMFDVDHVDNPREIFEKTQVEGFPWEIVMGHKTSSGRGLRLVAKARPEIGNIADNQIELAMALGVMADASCVDASRISYAPSIEDVYYLNEEELINYYNEEFDKKYCEEYRQGHTEPTDSRHSFDDCAGHSGHHPAKKAAPADKAAESGSGDERKVDAGQVENNDVKWRGYELQSIIDARYGDKLPCKEDSNRHAESLKLATDLMLMLDGDKALVRKVVEAQPWVQEIIDERDENVEQTVESAAGCIAEKEKKYASSLPSKAMQEAVKAACGRNYQEIIRGDKETGRQGVKDNTDASDITQRLEEWGERIEELFGDYPILRDICKGLKRNQYAAALFVAGGLLMTLMTRCTYRFYHRPEELRRLNNSTLIIGDPASGKSFATRLYKILAAPIIKADKVGKDAINAYREEVKTKGANKEKPKKPKVVIRVHPARTSNAQFIQDMVNAVENVDGEDMQLHMLTFDTELDNTLTVQKGGSWIDKMSLELKAFHNEEDGQAYSNLDSILQDFFVIWNYIYTGTPDALKKKVNSQNFGTGLATRLTCIPLPETDFQMISRESTVDHESDNRLKEWAEKLDRMKGELSVQKIVDELYDWTARRMEDAKENNSKADEMLLKRCAYHGLNFSAPYIVMRHWDKMHQEGSYYCGEFETDDVDWKLAELIVNIQYACQRHFFGAMAEAYFDNKVRDASVNVRRQKKTFDGFDRLPDEFTADDVERCFSLNNHNAAKSRIKSLIKDNLIIKSGEFCGNGTHKAIYRKTGCIMI
jgi:hypothetical protein